MSREQKICAVQGCENTVARREWCNRHYLRFLRHGDPLGGGYDHCVRDKFLREVVLLHQGDDCLIWPFYRNKTGYGMVRYNGMDRIASRVICQIIHGEPPTANHEAAHSCGRGHEGCVNPRHISWKTPKENMADKLIHGTHNRGDRHPLAKLTQEDVKLIRSLRGKRNRVDLARQFNIHPDTVCALQRGVYWSWLPF